jgi:hypothetical protein
LENSQQSHIVRYLQADGKVSSGDNRNWPLVCSPKIESLKQNQPSCIELIDPSNGLLDELVSSGCINYRQLHRIDVEATDEHKNKRLLRILLRKSVGDFENFIECLLKTKQPQVVSLIAPDEVTNAKPLRKEILENLTRQHATLVQLINPDHLLLDENVFC